MRVAVPADIVHGKLTIAPSWRTALQEALLVWPDGPVEIAVEQPAVTRSARANAYYWGKVIEAIAESTHNDPDDVHESMKLLHLPKAVCLRTGNGEVVAEFVIGGSTTLLTSTQFFDYVERIRMWAFEKLDCDIPPPDPEWRQHALDAERLAAAESTPMEAARP